MRFAEPRFELWESRNANKQQNVSVREIRLATFICTNCTRFYTSAPFKAVLLTNYRSRWIFAVIKLRFAASQVLWNTGIIICTPRVHGRSFLRHSLKPTRIHTHTHTHTHTHRVFQKELYNDIPNFTLWRVLRKRLHFFFYSNIY
jgi:hypothetical protein